MVAVTSTVLVQLAAGAAIVLVFAGLMVSRLSRRKSFRQKQFKMALILSLPPTLIILGVQEVLTGWIALAAVGGTAAVTLLVRERE